MTSDRVLGGAAIAVACAVAALAVRGERVAEPPPSDRTSPRLRAREPVADAAALLRDDPLRAFALGRDLFVREFSAAEGLFGAKVAHPVLEDGRTPVVPGSQVASCAACHNAPFGDAGAGPTIAKNGPAGRSTPHLFGAGLVEMTGWEIRRRLLALADRDGNGFVDLREARGRAVVANLPENADDERVPVDFGSFADDDGDGAPDLDDVCRVTYVDDLGRRVPGARSLREAGVAGYDVEIEVFGWGHAPSGRAPLSSTLRGFSAAAFNVHQGLQAHDPTLNADAGGRCVVGASLLGAPQFATGRTPDRGLALTPRGESLDDPDGDGVADELTERDLDLVEFFLLNQPAPAELPRTAQTERGRARFASFGCTSCHVPDWELPAADGASALGDRRTLAWDASFDAATSRWRVRVAPRRAPSGAAVRVRGVYSDFRRHDLGPAFHEQQFDGTVQRTFRTPPLWGVGSSAPYGHDGASLDLDAVIRRHGGDASGSAVRYAETSAEEREALLAFLRGLVLFATDGAEAPSAR